MATKTWICHYCAEDFAAPSEYLLLNHIRLVHSCEPGFSIQCNAHGCSRTFKNFRTYQNHKLSHNEASLNQGSSDLDDNSNEDMNPQQTDPTTNNEVHSIGSNDIQSYAVKWILKTRESRGLTRAATDGIIEDVQDLIEFVTLHLKSNVDRVLESTNVDQDILSAIDDVFNSPVTKPFNGVKSFYQQLQYCKKNFNFVVWNNTCTCTHCTFMSFMVITLGA